MKIDQNPSQQGNQQPPIYPCGCSRVKVNAGLCVVYKPGQIPARSLQPSLPGAEAVRDAEHATPEFDLPFALTAEAVRDDGARARGLFDDDDAREARRLMGCE